MKKNFDFPLLDMKDRPVIDPDGVTITAESLVVNALLADFPEEKASGPEKARRFKLAVKISSGGEVDLKAEDVADIKKVVGQAYAPLAVGRLYDMLDA